MESLTMTLGIIAFIWGIAFFTMRARKEKLNEKRERRMEQFQESLEDILAQDTTAPKTTPSPTKPLTQTPKPLPNDTPAAPITPQEPQPTQSNTTPSSHAQEYRAYLADRYQKLGYSIWDHHSHQDLAIDIIAKKQQELLLIRCEYIPKKQSQTVDINAIKAFRIDAQDFIDANPIFQNYQPKLLLILSNDIVDSDAKAYIQKLQAQAKLIDYQEILF